MAWLRQIEWPFNSAIFDGEACAGDGHEGIQAVFTERNRHGRDMALVLFDLLHQPRNNGCRSIPDGIRLHIPPKMIGSGSVD